MKTKHKIRITPADLTGIALFTALTAVLSQISIPLPTGIPVTLQTFAIALCGFVLGYRAAALSTLCYLLLGAVGVPVFSGFGAGFGKLAGVTGGFLWGFLPMAVLCGIAVRKPLPFRFLFGAAGLVFCHLAGVLQFAAVSGNTVLQAFSIASLPYLIKDLISLGFACTLALLIRKRLSAASILPPLSSV